MRSSVLFWYWCISWTATIPCWYPWGLFNPLFETLLFASAAILANIWVGEDPSNLSAASNPSNCPLLSNSPVKGVALPEGALHWGPSSSLHLALSLSSLSAISSTRSEIVAGFSNLHAVFSFWCYQIANFRLEQLSKNGRKVGPSYTYFGEGGQGVWRGCEGAGRYYLL